MRVRVLPSGTLKRIWIDRERASLKLPAWIVEVIDGPLEERLAAHSFEIVSAAPSGSERVLSMEPPSEPLHPSGPAYWLETRAQMVVIID